ncbi:MAG: hypothetical protein NC097_08415 [Clostridium sp.]|nr:hypothetical protein [Clostridium sp.]
METTADLKCQQAKHDIKKSFNSAVDAAKAGYQGIKEKAKEINQQKMESNPQYRANVEKAEGFIDTLKEKTADALRAGAKGAQKLANKIN